MLVTVLWNTRHRAGDIAELPVDSPLPCRPALVPRGRVAHALRRELIRIEPSDALAGTRFLSVGVAAGEVLHAARVHAAAGNCNLDRKNPHAKEDSAHLPPEQIAAGILEKEQRIAEIMGHIQKLLAGGGS